MVLALEGEFRHIPTKVYRTCRLSPYFYHSFLEVMSNGSNSVWGEFPVNVFTWTPTADLLGGQTLIKVVSHFPNNITVECISEDMFSIFQVSASYKEVTSTSGLTTRARHMLRPDWNTMGMITLTCSSLFTPVIPVIREMSLSVTPDGFDQTMTVEEPTDFEIVGDSASMRIEERPYSNNLDWVFTWVTDRWTDPVWILLKLNASEAPVALLRPKLFRMG